MKRIITRLLGEEDGTALIILAAALTVLIGFTALVTDLGNLCLHRAKISNTIDSAVMAGVQELPGDPGEALDEAEDYARANGLEEGEYSFQISHDGRCISGEGRRRVDMFLARVLGIDHSDVNARAVARVAPLTGTTGVVPFGVVDGDYEFGREIILKRGAGEGNYHGCFGALRLGGNGANVYKNNIMKGYNGHLRIGSVIGAEPGDMSGHTSAGVNYRINQCHHVPRCTASSYVDGCPRICIVPMGYWDDGCGCNRKFTITAFGAFFLDRVDGQGNKNNVWGSFIQYVVPGEIDEDGPETGLYGMELIE